MKKYLLLLLMLCAFNIFSYCKGEEAALNFKELKKTYASQEDLKKIDEETRKCIDTHFETDYTMMLCVIEGRKKYNIEIERIMKAAQDILSKPQYEKLLQSQRSWREFMAQNNIFLKEAFGKNCPPYLSCLTSEDNKYEFTKSRAENLSGTLGVFLLFKQNGVLDDELNFVKLKN